MAQPECELDFVYADCDTHANEIAELYSYTESCEFELNKTSFEDLCDEWNVKKTWTSMDSNEKNWFVERLCETVELGKKELRFKGLQALLYLAQGVFNECWSIEEQQSYSKENVFRIYEKGLFPTLIQLLMMEVETSLNSPDARRPPSNKNDSTDLRIILNIIYTIVEVFNSINDQATNEEKKLQEQFKEELTQPISTTNELLALTLFQMTTKFCNGSAPHFPIKKILLLLWKTILITLGGSEELKNLKNYYRSRVGLPPAPDDTLEITRTMRAASPPVAASETFDVQLRKIKLNKRRMISKQESLMADDMMNDMEETGETNGEVEQAAEASESSEVERTEEMNDKNSEEKVDIGYVPASPRPSTPVNKAEEDAEADSEVQSISKGLPWMPKVRHKDIDAFLEQARIKFIGFNIPQNRTTIAGLPEPILEGLRTLQKHLYISLSELQIQREEEIAKYPLTLEELDIKPLSSPAESLYENMLPSLPQYMIALLKILLAAAPTSKAKTESVNIMCEVLPENMPMTVVQSMKFGTDINRHKEIIIKAVSAILILLLKHFKINNIYQFENVSQQLMFANCIPLILKFFNQNIFQYIISRNNIALIDFPACVIGVQPEITAELLEMSVKEQPYPWRNIFSCINMVRILNKLTKWKMSRIMMLVVFKSAPILKRALRVRHAMFQLYVLKLLKMQAKYLGRQWRKSNMKTLSAIYQMVRHRLTDDWAFGNDMETRPWDFQGEEFSLQANISRFHCRRYNTSQSLPGIPSHLPNQQTGNHSINSINGHNSCNNSLNDNYSYAAQMDIFKPVDNNYASVLSKQFQLTEEFKNNYELWLQREVFQFNIDWDLLLEQTNTSNM